MSQDNKTYIDAALAMQEAAEAFFKAVEEHEEAFWAVQQERGCTASSRR